MRALMVDGNNHVHPDYHVCRNPSIAAKRMSARVARLAEATKATVTIVAWDAVGGSWRSQLYAPYKANRKTAPTGIAETISAAISALDDFEIPSLQVPLFEADDVLASATTEFVARGYQVILSSNDKDLAQLLQAGSVTQMRKWSSDRGQFQLTFMTEADLLAETGLTPAQFLDAQTLAGDRTDNIPGCPGIGMPTAIDLIRRAGSLTDLFRNPFIVSRPAQRSAVIAFAKSADLSRQLVTLRKDVPLPDHAFGVMGCRG